MAISLLYSVAMLDFEPGQWSQIKAGADPSENLAGRLGVELSGWSIHLLGVVSVVMPLLLFYIAYLLIFKKAHRVGVRMFFAGILVVMALSGLANLVEKQISDQPVVTVSADGPEFRPASEAPEPTRFFFNGLGGSVGRLLYNDWVNNAIGPFGTTLLLSVALVIGLVFISTENITQYLEGWHDRRAARAKEKAAARAARLKEKQEKKLLARQEKKNNENRVPAPLKSESKKKELKAGEASIIEDVSENGGEDAKESHGDGVLPPEGLRKKGQTRFLSPKKLEVSKESEEPAADSMPAKPLEIVAPEHTERAGVSLPDKRGDYVFPKVELLADPDEEKSEDRVENYEETAEVLVRTLGEFNVKVEPSSVQTGPVITRYEVTPAPGVRVEKIANLDKNIALGLKALAVRILAPVPGKGTVGIEVPNKHPQAVRMKEIVESRAWADNKAEIPIVLGKDVTGKPIVEDLTKMPHMLIAGSTGSGKTVCINAVIASLVYHSGPEDLRFIMVDPKVVEMQVYNKLPHMLIPVVTEPKKVPGALKYLLREMERRYQLFAKVGVRNIAGFNSKLATEKKEREAAEALDREMTTAMSPEERAAAASVEVPRDEEMDVPDEKLPYIVCIIDELADLMMVAPQDIETGVARLAQLARAAGIHLILATQRPSVNVITGVIKANLPTRISFKVASKVDSRTILDTGGAEALIGKGDMLFVPPGAHTLVRAQGAFVSDEEINGIVEFIHDKNGEPLFDESVQAAVESAGDEEGESGAAAGTYEDDLVPDAIGVLKASKRASTSMLQRRLKIGYNRAARIMEILEDEGIVGPENGSSPREILKDLDTL